MRQFRTPIRWPACCLRQSMGVVNLVQKTVCQNSKFALRYDCSNLRGDWLHCDPSPLHTNTSGKATARPLQPVQISTHMCNTILTAVMGRGRCQHEVQCLASEHSCWCLFVHTSPEPNRPDMQLSEACLSDALPMPALKIMHQHLWHAAARVQQCLSCAGPWSLPVPRCTSHMSI